MANVTPGYTFTSSTDSITHTKLNLLGQPTVTIGTNEVTTTNFEQVATNTLLGRITTGTGDLEIINLANSGIGYRTGAGGTVTQSTSKSTGVTLNAMSGQITMNAAALAADTTVSFTLTNSKIAAGDLLILNHISGGTAGSYTLNAQSASGSASINVRNVTAGSLSEAVVIAFGVFKAATA